MSTRAQVCMVEGDEKLYLYMHYDGYELPNVVRRALARGTDRWDDFEYLGRIIFCEMITFQAWWENVRPRAADSRDKRTDEQRAIDYRLGVVRAVTQETTGYGIGTDTHGDIEYLVTVDVGNRTVTVEKVWNEKKYEYASFKQFIEDGRVEWYDKEDRDDGDDE